MLYREFGKTGWKISAVGLGCWNIGNQWGEMDEKTAIDIVRAALDAGMNLVDVAESYGIPNGESELRVGKALEGIRDRVYVVSKIANWGKRTGEAVPKTTVDMIRLCVHACAGRLRTHWVDLMLCHDAKIQDPSIYIEGFEALKQEGFIREYGISTDDLDVLKNFQDKCGGRCAAVEIDYSLINRAPEAEMLPYCQEQGIAVLARGPVAQGLLAGKYDAQTVFTDSIRSQWNEGENGRQDFEAKLAKVRKVKESLGADDDMVSTALRYVISHRSAPVAIPGATRVEQAIGNAKAGVEMLSAEALVKLQAD